MLIRYIRIPDITVPVITPDKRSDSDDELEFLDINKTNNRTSIAPVKANKLVNEVLITVIPVIKARAAPTAEPLDKPRVNGSAKGFRNIAWKIKPEQASDAPVTKAPNIRIKRKLKINLLAWLVG
jgi:hypothetical protein